MIMTYMKSQLATHAYCAAQKVATDKLSMPDWPEQEFLQSQNILEIIC